MTVPFELVGVFGARVGGGSPLAVVHDADKLDDADLRWIAARLRADETVFVLPPTVPEATHRVRVFNRSGESPFGGHSAVGTAVALVRSGRLPAGRVVQQCGDVLLELHADAERARITATGPRPVGTLDADRLLDTVGLGPADLDGDAARAGFGPMFHLLPVRADAVARAHPDLDRMRRDELPDLFVFHWDPTDRTATARLFAPGYAIDEDPACASVVLALGAWLHAGGLLAPEADFRVQQGTELDRPSRLDGTLRAGAGRLTVTVAGRAPTELSGDLVLPGDRAA